MTSSNASDINEPDIVSMGSAKSREVKPVLASDWKTNAVNEIRILSLSH